MKKSSEDCRGAIFPPWVVSFAGGIPLPVESPRSADLVLKIVEIGCHIALDRSEQLLHRSAVGDPQGQPPSYLSRSISSWVGRQSMCASAGSVVCRCQNKTPSRTHVGATTALKHLGRHA
ncbi:hypothetical protein ES705_50308 [subsurface metagenome]